MKTRWRYIRVPCCQFTCCQAAVPCWFAHYSHVVNMLRTIPASVLCRYWRDGSEFKIHMLSIGVDSNWSITDSLSMYYYVRKNTLPVFGTFLMYLTPNVIDSHTSPTLGKGFWLICSMMMTTQIHASTLTTLAADCQFFSLFYILDVWFLFAVPFDQMSCIAQRMFCSSINHIALEMPTYWPQPTQSVDNVSIRHRNGDLTIEHAWMYLECTAVSYARLG